jgi:hypothetical protein
LDPAIEPGPTRERVVADRVGPHRLLSLPERGRRGEWTPAGTTGSGDHDPAGTRRVRLTPEPTVPTPTPRSGESVLTRATAGVIPHMHSHAAKTVLRRSRSLRTGDERSRQSRALSLLSCAMARRVECLVSCRAVRACPLCSCGCKLLKSGSRAAVEGAPVATGETGFSDARLGLGAVPRPEG